MGCNYPTVCRRKPRVYKVCVTIQADPNICVTIQADPNKFPGLTQLNGIYRLTPTGKYYATRPIKETFEGTCGNDKCFQFITKITNDDPQEHFWVLGDVYYSARSSKTTSYVCYSEGYPITRPLPDPTTIRRWYSFEPYIGSEMINPPNGKQIIYRGSC